MRISLVELRVEELREMAKRHNIVGAWKMRKEQLVMEILKAEERMNTSEEIIETQEQTEQEVQSENNLEVEEMNEMTDERKPEANEVEEIVNENNEVLPENEEGFIDPKPSTEHRHRGGRTKKIEVYKDGELIKTLDSLSETFKWSVENNIANAGWVKESLNKGIETKAGRKFKVGGYLFKYAE